MCQDTIVLHKFLIHVPITDNKKTPNKYIKINNQSIYSGVLNRFGRAIAVRNIHKWINLQFANQKLPNIDYPVEVSLDIYTVINHGDIRRKKDGTISWKKPSDDYQPRFDIDNLLFLWFKCINDTLTKAGVWRDDDVSIVQALRCRIYFIDELDDRKIEISFKKL